MTNINTETEQNARVYKTKIIGSCNPNNLTPKNRITSNIMAIKT